MKYCFVFVCQGGLIEPQAALLAASLRRNVKCKVEVVAAVPEYAGVQPISQKTIDFLYSLDIRMKKITNLIDKSYLIANKIMCFSIPTDADYFIFLDSDMICFREIHSIFFDPRAEFSARLTDFSDLHPREWDEIYQYCQKETPSMNYLSLVTHEAMPLYFNSGMIISSEPEKLYQYWLDYACKLNDKDRFPKTRPFLDQISLSLAVADINPTIRLLDQEHHFSSSIYPIDVFNLPFFVHYFEGIHLLGDSQLSDFSLSLVHEYKGLREILQFDPDLSLLD